MPLKGLLRNTALYHFLRDTALYHLVRDHRGPWRERREVRDWVKKGLPVRPPHAVKQAVLRAYARRYNIRVLVETGTYRGDMVQAMKKDFERIYSIELSQNLFQKARDRFKGHPEIVLLQGESSEELKAVLPRLNEPTLFWLDGHYSGGVTTRGKVDTPVRDEIEHILTAWDFEHVILVDDARLFGGDPAYPTLEELRKQVLSKRPSLSFTVEVDIIRITPNQSLTDHRNQL